MTVGIFSVKFIAFFACLMLNIAPMERFCDDSDGVLIRQLILEFEGAKGMAGPLARKRAVRSALQAILRTATKADCGRKTYALPSEIPIRLRALESDAEHIRGLIADILPIVSHEPWDESFDEEEIPSKPLPRTLRVIRHV